MPGNSSFAASFEGKDICWLITVGYFHSGDRA